MRVALFALFALLAHAEVAFADLLAVPNSVSPDGKLHAVMDVDRKNPTISPDGSYPQIEVTDKSSGQVIVSIAYFGAQYDDSRTLREHIRVHWRSDSKAFSVTINDRFYSSSKVFALNKKLKFIEVAFPSYKTMTGFPDPDNTQLKPQKGRSSVKEWDSNGRLIYHISMSPLPTYSGDDPLEHTVLLEVTPEGMIPAKKTKAEQDATGQPATRPESK